METVSVHGAQIPALGFGTFELAPQDAQPMVTHALRTGYRHIDTAQAYNNEAAVGAGIRNANVTREELFLTTKVWVDRFHDGDLQASARESLERLGTDYLDLLLLHWPNQEVPIEETIGALNDVRKQGLARHIGVSNFTANLLNRAVSASDAPLVTNQVEYHPFLDQRPVQSALNAHDMALTAYCPLARGTVFGNSTLAEIGKAHGKNEGQAALRWLLQQERVIAIPRSRQAKHVETNFQIFDFELSPNEMERITSLARSDGRMINPSSLAPEWDRTG